MVHRAELIINGRHIHPGVRRHGEGIYVPLQRAVPRLGGRLTFADRGPLLSGPGGELSLEGDIFLEGDLAYAPSWSLPSFFGQDATGTSPATRGSWARKTPCCGESQSSSTPVMGGRTVVLRGATAMRNS